MAGRRGRRVYSTPEWRAFRAAAIEAAGYRCQRCGNRGALEAHHRDRLADGGAAVPRRLEDAEVLCRDCHLFEHNPARRPTPESREWDRLVAELP